MAGRVRLGEVGYDMARFGNNQTCNERRRNGNEQSI